jgi:hypothetical protein
MGSLLSMDGGLLCALNSKMPLCHSMGWDNCLYLVVQLPKPSYSPDLFPTNLNKALVNPVSHQPFRPSTSSTNFPRSSVSVAGPSQHQLVCSSSVLGAAADTFQSRSPYIRTGCRLSLALAMNHVLSPFEYTNPPKSASHSLLRILVKPM